MSLKRIAKRLGDAVFGPPMTDEERAARAEEKRRAHPMYGKNQVGHRKCLGCEGHGVRRKYIDRAGDYEKYHCQFCGGTGNEPDSGSSPS